MCLMFVGRSNMMRMICGPGSPGRQPISQPGERTFYGRVGRFRGHSDPGNGLNPEPFIAGRNRKVIFVAQDCFAHPFRPRRRWADAHPFARSSYDLDAPNTAGALVSCVTTDTRPDPEN